VGEDEDQYEIIDKNIGAKRGSFAQIMLARAPGRGARVIMKCIPLKGSSKKCQLHALKEAEILQRLVHPHIVGFIDSFLYRGSLVIVQEWCERKDLRLLLVKKKYQKQYLQEETIRRGIFEIVKAVAYLHRKEFLHRDLKCANCFLTANNQMATHAGCLPIRRSTTYYQDPIRRRIIWHPRYAWGCRMWLPVIYIKSV